jgi:hypothetical protein
VFSNLKIKVHRHLESSTHREMIKLESAPKKTEGKTHKVGMIVSAIAYEIIFEGHSFHEFERHGFQKCFLIIKNFLCYFLS